MLFLFYLKLKVFTHIQMPYIEIPYKLGKILLLKFNINRIKNLQHYDAAS